MTLVKFKPDQLVAMNETNLEIIYKTSGASAVKMLLIFKFLFYLF